jgi:aminobenzoyl-glutamate utilization protein B
LPRKKILLPTWNLFKAEAISDIQSRYEEYKKIAFQIWGFAEVGYKEEKSAALLAKNSSR